MKSKQLVFLSAALVVAAGIAFYKMGKRTDAIGSAPAEVGTAILKDFKPENLGPFTVSDGKLTVDVGYVDGKHVVTARDNFPASQTAVNELRDNAGQLKVLAMQKVGDSQLGRLHLLDPSKPESTESERGKLVVLKDTAGAEVASFLVGKTLEPKSDGGFNMSPGPSPQYIKVKGVEGSVYQAKQGFQAINADPKLWLDKENFFKIEKLKSVTVVGPTAEETYKVVRDAEGGELKLDAPKAGETFDASKASGTGSVFAYASFEDVATASDKDKSGLDKPTHTAVIETFDGFTYSVKVGNKVAPNPADTASSGAENYYMNLVVDGKFEETRTAPPPDKDGKPTETEEQKKTADEAFAKTLQTKKDKLTKEQGLKDRVFIVSKSSLDPIMKKRTDLMKDPEKPAEAEAGSSGSDSPKLPKGTVEVKPGGKIEATTPPISVDIPQPQKEPAAK